MDAGQLAGKWRILGGLAMLSVLLDALSGVAAQEWTYTVRPGDNLWDLSRKYLRDIRNLQQLQNINNIINPLKIPPGSSIRIPVPWLKVQPVPVRVIHVRGAASVLHDSGEINSLTAQMTLTAGDTVLTAEDSGATLEFADGSRVRLQENGRLRLDTVTAYGRTGMVDSRMRLLDGRLESDAAPVQPPAGRFEIWTPAATTAVRGTRFRAAMRATENLAMTEVADGAVTVSSTGERVAVMQGFGTVVAEGEPPLPPRPLLPALDLAALPPRVTAELAAFNFAPLAGAVAYRAQLAQARAPDAVLFDRVFSAPPVAAPVTEEGDYVVTIRGVDALGLEGLDAIHRFAAEFRPAAPNELSATLAAQAASDAVTFLWQPKARAVRYQFQLAAQEDFSAPLVELVDIATTRWALAEPLPPGTYFWRVAGIDSQDRPGDYSATQQLIVPPPPASLPEITRVTAHGDDVWVQWSGIDAAADYELQVAYDSAFADVHSSVVANTTQARLRHPRVESYYLRVRQRGSSPHAGSFGPTHHVAVDRGVLWRYGVLFAIVGLASL